LSALLVLFVPAGWAIDPRKAGEARRFLDGKGSGERHRPMVQFQSVALGSGDGDER
jgi:hypothetical protein